MKKPVLIAFLFSQIFLNFANAGKQGPLNYKNNSLFVTIVNCDTDFSGAVVIPDEIERRPVRIVATGAFRNCRGVNEITISDNVDTIGEDVFLGCSNLRGVVWGAGLTSIPNGCFKDLMQISSVTLPNTLTSIGNSAFQNCRELTNIRIPNSVTSIGGSAFADCRALRSINIPEGISAIKPNAFEFCYSLTRITLPKSLITLQRGAFYCCENIELIKFRGNAPSVENNPFGGIVGAAVVVSDTASGFGETFEGFPVIVEGSSDRDNDGVTDNQDAFPNDPTETSDLDGDGVGDNSDAFPNYKGESADSDGNGIGDNAQSSIEKEQVINDLNKQLTQRNAEINTLKAQLASANSTIAEKDQEIARLSDGVLSLEQVQDGRLGSIVLTPIPNTNMTILNIDIEQSEDLKTWTLYRKILESISMPEGKKFYRFALDK